jgi:hypothetical protein
VLERYGKSDAGLNRQPLRPGGAPGNVIEPGRALAIADFSAPALGAGERLIRLAYRIGVPSSLLTSPLGKKARPRLLATVENPLPGDRVAGTALRAGHFLVHGAQDADRPGRFRRGGADDPAA